MASPSSRALKNSVRTILLTVARTCPVGPRLSIPNYSLSIGGHEKPRTYKTGPRYNCLLRIRAVVLHLVEEDGRRNVEALAEPRNVVAIQSTLAGKNQ